MKVKLVKVSQRLAQVFTKWTLGYSVKVKLVKRFTMYTLDCIGGIVQCQVSEIIHYVYFGGIVQCQV